MQTAANTTLQKSPKAKKIQDIVKPDATMRLHQRLFDRRRKHHIAVKEENTASPGASLSAYLIPARYRRTPVAPTEQSIVTTAPVPVVRYSEITRDAPFENYLTAIPAHARSFMDRVVQRYHVFIGQHKPFYYSLSSGTASGWLTNPRARVALAGSALALLMFFIGAPSSTPTGPDNPAGRNPIVIQDMARESSATPEQEVAPTSDTSSSSSNAVTQPNPTATPLAPNPTSQSDITTPVIGPPANGGGYGSGLTTPPPNPTTQPNTVPTPPTNPIENLIQDIIKPTPITIPGQDIQIDDKRILQTSDTTILIN